MQNRNTILINQLFFSVLYIFFRLFWFNLIYLFFKYMRFQTMWLFGRFRWSGLKLLPLLCASSYPPLTPNQKVCTSFRNLLLHWISNYVNLNVLFFHPLLFFFIQPGVITSHPAVSTQYLHYLFHVAHWVTALRWLYVPFLLIDDTTWPRISPQYCSGSRQSPINIVSASATPNDKLTEFTFFKYDNTSAMTSIENTGDTGKHRV